MEFELERSGRQKATVVCEVRGSRSNKRLMYEPRDLAQCCRQSLTIITVIKLAVDGPVYHALSVHICHAVLTTLLDDRRAVANFLGPSLGQNPRGK